MATHSSILAWRISWTEEPGSLQSLGLHSIRHNWSDLAQHSNRWHLKSWIRRDHWGLTVEWEVPRTVKARLVLAVVPTVAVITHYSCLLEQLQYRQVSQNLSFLFLVQISLRKAVLETSVGNISSGSGGLGYPPWSHPPTELDRLKHWASVDLGLSPGFTLPGVKPFWISAASFIQRGSPCTDIGGVKEVNVSSLPSTLTGARTLS